MIFRYSVRGQRQGRTLWTFRLVWAWMAGAALLTAAPSPTWGQQPPKEPAPQTGSAWLGLLGEDDETGRVPGVAVLEVREGGPAARAKLVPGDRIVGMASLKINTMDDLALLTRQLEPGQNVQVDFVRDGLRLNAVLQIQAKPAIATPPLPPPVTPLPDAPDLPPPFPPENTAPSPISLGIRVRAVAPTQVAGVLIERVAAASPAHQAGLRAGQIITSLDDHPVRSPDDLADLLGEVTPGQSIRLQIVTESEQQREVLVKFEAADASRLTSPIEPLPNQPEVVAPPDAATDSAMEVVAALTRRIQDLERQLQVLQQRLEALEANRP